jgi:hypothetical protein
MAGYDLEIGLTLAIGLGELCHVVDVLEVFRLVNRSAGEMRGRFDGEGRGELLRYYE